MPGRDAPHLGERRLGLLGVSLGADAGRPLELAALGGGVDAQQLDLARRRTRRSG